MRELTVEELDQVAGGNGLYPGGGPLIASRILIASIANGDITSGQGVGQNIGTELNAVADSLPGASS